MTTTTTEEFEQLRLLLNGALSNRAANALKKRIAEDAEFRTEAIEYLSLMRQLKAIDPVRDEVKAILQKTATTPEPKNGLIFSLYLMRYGAVASVALLLGFSFYFLYNLSFSPRITLNENEMPNIISGFTKSVEGELPIAEFEFRQKHYEQAAAAYFSAHQAEPQDMDLLYNYAAACFMDKKWGKAEKAFEKLAAMTQFHKHEDAAFYQAICLLNEKKDEQGLELLQRIISQKEHKKHMPANEIWRKMKKK